MSRQPEPKHQSSAWPRLFAVGITSFIAEKIWGYRHLVLNYFIASQQSGAERILAASLAYLSIFGALFIIGIVVGKGVGIIQKLN